MVRCYYAKHNRQCQEGIMRNSKRIPALILTVVMIITLIPTSALAATARWKKSGSNWTYILSNGKKATGWKKISKKWYYFNSKGIMQTGLKTIKSKYYYFNSKGAMKTGWVTIKSKKHYFSKKDGHGLKNGWKKIGSKYYYFDKKGVLIEESSSTVKPTVTPTPQPTAPTISYYELTGSVTDSEGNETPVSFTGSSKSDVKSQYAAYCSNHGVVGNNYVIYAVYSDGSKKPA